MRKQLISTVLLAGCLSGLLSGCSTTEVAAPASEKTVSVVQTTTQTFDTGIYYIGVVQPKETHNHAFLTGGKIDKLYVEKGDYVSAGDLLAKLDTTQLELSASMSAIGSETARNTISTLEEALAASQLALETAQLNLERTQTLYELGMASSVELETMQLQFASQQATYVQLQNDLANARASAASSGLTQQQVLQNLEDATLTADRDGVVMELPYKEGEVVGAGYPVVITKSEELMVTVGLSVEDYNKVTKDCAVSINGALEGTIETIATYPDPNTRVYTVEILFSGSDLSAGDTVDVIIYTGQETGSLVPVDSVFQVDGLNYVYVVDEENRIIRQQITLGTLDGSNVRVTDLAEHTQVVAGGVKLLSENDVVSIVDGGTPDSANEESEWGDET